MHLGLAPNLVRRAVDRLPPQLRVFLEQNPELLIVGGWVRAACTADEFATDVDLFGPDPHRVRDAAAEYAASVGPSFAWNETPDAVTIRALGQTVQFVTKWSVHDLDGALEIVDFTICQAAIGYLPKQLAWIGRCSSDFLPDLATRYLHLKTPPVPIEHEGGGTLLRAFRFVGRGYTIAPRTIAEIVLRTYKRLQKQHGLAPDLLDVSAILQEIDPAILNDGEP